MNDRMNVMSRGSGAPTPSTGRRSYSHYHHYQPHYRNEDHRGCCNLVCDIPHFRVHCVYFTETCKNNIVDGTFTKLQYSDSMVTFHGIYLYFSLWSVTPPDRRSLQVASPTTKCPKEGEEMSVSNTPGFPHHLTRQHVYFSFTHPVNYAVMKDLIHIEHALLEHYKQWYNVPHKQNVYSLRNQLRCGTLRVYASHSHHMRAHSPPLAPSSGTGTGTGMGTTPSPSTMRPYVLKISGVWETATHLGITYKYVDASRAMVMAETPK